MGEKFGKLFFRHSLGGILLTREARIKNLPEKVLQFGEGNFLRAFFDHMVEILNENGYFNGRVAVVQPIANGLAETINAQDGMYTVLLRGLENQQPTVHKKIVTSVSRCINPYQDFETYKEAMRNPDLRFIVSNTTEAGIEYRVGDSITDKPPISFPAKITALLHERYSFFEGDSSKGLIFIPCELIDYNGTKLKEIVFQYANEWNLGSNFIEWIEKANHFTNTLVDRIVTGYPKDEIETLTQELGYEDKLLVAAEIFHFFAIEASPETMDIINQEMPFHKVGLNVILTDNATPYKQRKVRILNGAHTMSVLAAFLAGHNTVGEMMEDPVFVQFLRKGVFDEIIPTLDMELEDLTSFAESVFDRFANPYIKHYLLSIALNSVAKYKTRVLPSILEYHRRTGKLPECLTMSFAALVAFYRGGKSRGGEPISDDTIQDDPEIVAFFKEQWEQWNNPEDIHKLVTNILAKIEYWDIDLNTLPGFADKVTEYLSGFFSEPEGVRKTIGYKI